MISAKRLQYTIAELTKGLDVAIKGDPNCVITGISSIQDAQQGCVTFLTNSLYRKYLETTLASAVILAEADAEACPINAIVCKNPYFVYAQIAGYFNGRPAASAGTRHISAVIAKSADVDASVHVGANCVIGERVKIAAHAVIGAGCVIGDDTEIGEAACLDANVTLYDGVKIGKRVHLSSGVVIGSDGFGFANHQGGWHKVPQLGTVEIGDDVDIGANTTIDRGAIENTVIGKGVKLDNLIQVAHNVKIGDHTVIAGCVGIAGSAVIGKHCMIGGSALINGHITITDNVIITGNTGVSKSITEPGIYSSGIVGAVPNAEFRKNNARFHRLENLMQRVKTLEADIKQLRERNDS
jgi:UDP-3-O-[3-hydroxymyristoyl] glucosamine N-acyltransferase